MGKMVSKFSGKCRKCHAGFPAGTVIDWTPGNGAVHFGGCPAVVVTASTVVAPTVFVEAKGIVDFLNAAKARGLKAPKVRFLAPGGGEMKMHMAGGATKYPGAVQIKVNGEWVGRINADGSLTHRAVALAPTLNTIVADPAKAAAEYGALVCKCSFCGAGLEDDGSVEVGYGPVCAKRYGLPHKPKGVRTLTPAA
jgi:hypothetical protein